MMHAKLAVSIHDDPPILVCADLQTEYLTEGRRHVIADAEAITTTIDFVLPNLRSEVIRAGKYWFSSLTTVTPITRDQCRIDVVAAWNLFRWIPFGPELLKFVFAKFVEQDRLTMEQQSEGLKHNPHLMLIDDADRPAKWYFGLKNAMLEMKRNGGEFRHPMAGAVTLKWRS